MLVVIVAFDYKYPEAPDYVDMLVVFMLIFYYGIINQIDKVEELVRFRDKRCNCEDSED